MADISEHVWNFVFEERRRVEDRSHTDDNITSKDFIKKMAVTNIEDADEATDHSDNDEECGPGSGFMFEEVTNLEEEE
jgi:hypothetical protein